MARPASWIATRPAADLAELAEVLDHRWGVVGVLSDLPSERDRNILVRPADGSPSVVLKIANLAEDPAFLACQTAAMVHLADAGLPVQRVLPARDGQSIVALGEPGPPLARLLTFLEGRPLASVGIAAPQLLDELGRMMGLAATALLDFDDPAARRDLQWDVQRAEAVITGGLQEVIDPVRRALLQRALAGIRERLVPLLPGLRTSVIHNDANDHNVLVDVRGESVVGLLDFGDMVHSVTAHEAAVASTYATFGQLRPLAVLARVVAAFDRACPLTDLELRAMPDLVLARLGASVAISAHQARLDPDPYLRISEAPAWDLLQRLEAEPVGSVRAAIAEAVGR